MTGVGVIRRTVAAAVLILAANAALSACGDEDAGGAAASPFTAPGTTLDVGEPATVPIGEDGVARVRVTRIETGRPADLRSFGATPKATVTYVWVEVDPVRGDVSDFAAYDHIHGWAGDDLVPHVLTDPATYAPCPTRYFPNDGPISTLETCTVFTSAEPIDRVGFHDGGDYRLNTDEINWR